MSPDQIASVVEEIRERVRSRHERTVPRIPDLELPPLDVLEHARDAAEVKASSIGTVNPRRAGVVNALIQSIKKAIARLLHWHVREQVDFNRAVIRYMDRNLEINIEQNHNILLVARGFAALQEENENLRQLNSGLRQANAELHDRVSVLGQQGADMLQYWNQWHPAWEEKLTQTEIEFLRLVREIESTAKQIESGSKQIHLKMHGEYLEALARSSEEVQQKLWADLARAKQEMDRLIHTELRLIRRRTPASAGAPAEPAPQTRPAAPAEAGAVASSNGAGGQWDSLDYARFQERFRGSEDHIERTQAFFAPYFEHCRNVLDLGCGRGEFLKLMRGKGIAARGVDGDADAIAACREKGVDAEQGDMFEYLRSQSDGSLDGIFCAHVLEHLPPHRVVELIALAAEKLAPSGVLAVETPNPRCLAIFAADFYLDPTHVRPIPPSLLSFYCEEAGLSGIEVHDLHPATEVFPELAALDKVEGLKDFGRRFFGGLDYALIGRKLET